MGLRASQGENANVCPLDAGPSRRTAGRAAAVTTCLNPHVSCIVSCVARRFVLPLSRLLPRRQDASVRGHHFPPALCALGPGLASAQALGESRSNNWKAIGAAACRARVSWLRGLAGARAAAGMAVPRLLPTWAWLLT